MKNRIELQKYRTFGEIFTGVFEFVFGNFKALFKFQLTVPLPLIFLGMAVLGYGGYSILDQAGAIGAYASENPFTLTTIAIMSVGLLILIAGFGLLVPIYYTQIMFYKNGKTNAPFDEVWPLAKKFIGRTIGVYLLITVLFIIVLVMLISLIAALGSVSGWFIFLGVLLYFGLAFAVAGLIPTILPALFLEDLSAIDAVARGMSIGARSFWTFVGTGIVMSLVVGIGASILNQLISLPITFIADMFMPGEQSAQGTAIVTAIVAMIPATFIVILQHLFYHTTSVFLYFSAVEKFEAKGLEEKIDEIV